MTKKKIKTLFNKWEKMSWLELCKQDGFNFTFKKIEDVLFSHYSNYREHQGENLHTDNDGLCSWCRTTVNDLIEDGCFEEINVNKSDIDFINKLWKEKYLDARTI